MRFLVYTAFYFFFYLEISAQTAISMYWNMQTLLPTTIVGANFQASEISVGNNYGNTQVLSNSSSSQGTYLGASGEQNVAIAARTGPLDKNINGSAYISITLTASPGYKLNISSLSMGIRSTTTGPQQIALFSNADEFQAPLLTQASLANSEWSYMAFPLPAMPSKSVIVFKLFGYGGVGNAAINVANWRLDDIHIQGTVLPESLPVKWQNFIAYPAPTFIKLVWTTNEEYNSSGFNICRSIDGVTFSILGFVKSDTTQIHGLNQYQYIDSFPPRGIAFYKIQHVDVDGTITEGPIRSIHWKYDEALENGIRNLSFQASAVYFDYLLIGKTTFSVYTINGCLMGKSTYYSPALTSRFIQVPCLSGIFNLGIYILVVESEGKRLTKKIGRLN